MPTWSEILQELQNLSAAGSLSPFDLVRRKYLVQLHQKTERNTILYATSWTQSGKTADPDLLSITDEDIQGLMEVVHGLQGTNLDLIIHSPGGSAEAAESIVNYLRTKFDNIRVIVPHAAMSAATMIACSANRLVMGKQSSIGPIDPQFILQTQVGFQVIPADAILGQFELAKEECRDPNNLAAWLPILGQYGPAMLTQCLDAIALAEELVSEWLEKYMFAGQPNSKEIACKIAETLSDHQKFKTHGRHISRNRAKEIGLIVEDLETDQTFQDLVLSVYHATTHTFRGTPAVKIIENHLGKAFINFDQKALMTSVIPSGNQPQNPPAGP